MMKVLQFKIVLLAMALLPMALSAGGGKDGIYGMNGRYTKEKSIKKEFRVNPDALLKISNSYGNLTLASWNEDRVEIEVHIKTNGNNEERVKERLEEIHVDFQNSPSLVSASTDFGSRSSGWSWGLGGRSKVSVEVNYTIKLPVKNNINLSNDYGSIFLDRIDGHAKISCDYGKLQIGELRGRNNEISFDYTSRSTFGYINSAEIVADYSGFTVEKAGDLKIRADYTNMTIQEMDHLDYSCDYGSLEAKRVGNVRGSGDYIGIKLGRVQGNVSISGDYGSLKIDQLAPDAGNVQINCDYTGIQIGYHPEYHFDFEISTEYADVRGMEDFEVNISQVKSTDRYYQGYHGAQNSGKKVHINSEYGGVGFNRNTSSINKQ